MGSSGGRSDAGSTRGGVFDVAKGALLLWGRGVAAARITPKPAVGMTPGVVEETSVVEHDV
jgi:hypothetical protein